MANSVTGKATSYTAGCGACKANHKHYPANLFRLGGGLTV